MNRTTTIGAAVLAFGLAALASQLLLRGSGGATTPDEPRPAAAKPGYPALLADLDRRIDGLQRRADGRPGDWLTRQHLASALLERAGLTQRLDDFDRVQAVLDEAFTGIPEGTGPVLVAARFNLAVHRLAAAEKYLDMIDRRRIPLRDDQVATRLLRAQIALQRGDYDIAGDLFLQVAAAAPTFAAAESAIYHANTGDPEKARRLLTEALASTPADDPQRRAWIELQLGLLALRRGELPTALAHLQAADAELPGWWLVQEHLAELHVRRSQHDQAVALYEKIVRTADLPQHMDALAALHRHLGEPAKADELVARAAARWEQHLARYPEAATGHALQHYLRFGPPERALELALADHAARPSGEAKVALARAYLKNGKPAEALAVAGQALASPYRSAALHDVAAKAHLALGDTAAAEAEVSRCYAIDPYYAGDDHTH
jgi:Tfp pilus assembly protein PilF